MKILKNIVMIMTDQFSAKWLELAIENKICPLPNFEKLINSGTYFSNAIINNPVCSPSRATIATGLTSRSHGVLQNGYTLNPNVPTFMSSLQKGGYMTGAFGKLHFKPHHEALDPDYSEYGFDVTHVTEDTRAGEWLEWIMEEHSEYLDDVLATVWASGIEEFRHLGKNKINLQDRIIKIRENYDWTTEKYPLNTANGYTQKFPKELTQTEWITRKALEFLEDESIEKPVFAHISYVQPHAPRGVPEEYMDYVDESKIPECLEAEWFGDENSPKYFHDKKPITHMNDHYQRKCYFADLVHLDEQIGKIMDCLSTNKKYEDSAILFFADHGELLGDHGFYRKEEKHYDACIRVPFIIAGTGMQKACVHKGMVQNEDICPTILDMANCKMPLPPVKGHENVYTIEKREEFYGKSLFGICKGEDKSERKYAYTESYNPIDSAEFTDWARTVRTQEYRYTYYPDYSGEQLFDLESDPDELVNLANNPEYIDVKRELKDALMELIIKQDYPRTPRDLFALGVH